LDRLGNLLDGSLARFGENHLGLGVALGGFEAAVGAENGGGFLTLGTGDGGPAPPFGGGLLFHHRLHGFGGGDVLDLNGLEGDPPVGDVVGDGGLEFGLDHVPRGEGVVEIHLADDGAQGGLDQGLDGDDVVGDAV